jgi:hypothetical protein
MSSSLWYRFGRVVGLAMILSSASLARADEMPGYRFEAAAQEITQLFWLAETATVCGWASEEDTLKFKEFSVRFLSAHLSGTHRVALVSLVTENGYEDKLRRVALEGAQHNCGNSRWHTGWVSYKDAADRRAQDF